MSGEILELFPLKKEKRMASLSIFVHNKDLRKKRRKVKRLEIEQNRTKTSSLSADNMIVFRENPREFHIYGNGMCIR